MLDSAPVMSYQPHSAVIGLLVSGYGGGCIAYSFLTVE